MGKGSGYRRCRTSGARVNTISPGIIFTPFAKDELTGPRGEGYRRVIELSLVGRGGPQMSRGRRRVPHGPRGHDHHRQRLPHGRWRDRPYFYGELAPR